MKYVMIRLVTILGLICFVDVFATNLGVNINQIKEVMTVSKKGNEAVPANFNITKLKIAPFDKNLVSFELEYNSDKDRRKFERKHIVFYNLKTKKYYRLDIRNFSDFKESGRWPSYDLTWHPSKKWFVCTTKRAYGNAPGEIFIGNIKSAELYNKYSIDGYRLSLNKRKYSAFTPQFSADGKKLYFSNFILSRGEDASRYDLCVIDDIENYIAKNKFTDVGFKILVKEDFDQLEPAVFPTSYRNLVAYVSKTNKASTRIKDDSYTEYSLNIYDNDNGRDYVAVYGMDGFHHYKFSWSPDGKYLLYYKAKPRYLTDSKYIEDGFNIINVHVVEVTDNGGSLDIKPIVSSNNEEIIIKDVKDYGSLQFLDKDKFIVIGYRDGVKKLIVVDLKKWKEGYECEQLVALGGSDVDPEYISILRNQIYLANMNYGNYEQYLSTALFRVSGKKSSLKKSRILTDLGATGTVKKKTLKKVIDKNTPPSQDQIIKKEIKKREKDLAKLKDDLKDIKGKISVEENAKNQESLIFSDLNTTLKRNQETLSDKNSKLRTFRSEKVSKLQEAGQKLAEYQSQGNNLKNSVKDIEKEMDNYRNIISQNKSEITSLTQDKNSKEKKLAELNEKINVLLAEKAGFSEATSDDSYQEKKIDESDKMLDNFDSIFESDDSSDANKKKLKRSRRRQ